MDFARGNRLLSWLVGGLNFQVEHHLFPQICHVHYAAIARLVELSHSSGQTLSLPYQPASPNTHLNTWTTLFAAQALTMATPGAPAISWPELV